MQFVDVKISLDSPEYSDISGLMERSIIEGVVAVVATTSSIASFQRMLKVRKRYPNFIFLALGVPPENPEVAEAEADNVIAFIRRMREEIVAVGQVGLPYYSIRERDDFQALLERGKPILQRFLKLARELDLAAILHAPHRSAAEALSIAKEVNAKKVVFHWHKSPPDVTKAIVKEGYYISVTPEVCYENRDRELVRLVPLSNLVLETDGPWHYEQEFSGITTEPRLIKRVAQEVAVLKGLPLEVVAERTTENAMKLFNFNR